MHEFMRTKYVPKWRQSIQSKCGTLKHEINGKGSLNKRGASKCEKSSKGWDWK